MKVLNLYSGIGGNRKLWENCEVTAVEYNKDIADVYSKLFPNDTVLVEDAHTYLEKHYKEFDFIWSSPPCPSHGQYRHNVGVLGKGFNPIMPDMKLYAEIVFLSAYFKGEWLVENVKPYYTPLITPTFILQRHLFWANFYVPEKSFNASNIRSKNKISDFDGYEVIVKSNIKEKRQVLRNCVDSKLGLYIFNCMLNQENFKSSSFIL